MSDLSAPDGLGANLAESPDAASPREPDALYQNGQIVARVGVADVDLATKEIRFDEIRNSEILMIPEECEFRDYRILIQRIGYATKIQRGEEHKGRVLRGVICDLLGYRER
ncbi:MAG: hypothetical protein ACM3NO_11450 [Deltaproteobacteria bacterium]